MGAGLGGWDNQQSFPTHRVKKDDPWMSPLPSQDEGPLPLPPRMRVSIAHISFGKQTANSICTRRLTPESQMPHTSNASLSDLPLLSDIHITVIHSTSFAGPGFTARNIQAWKKNLFLSDILASSKKTCVLTQISGWDVQAALTRALDNAYVYSDGAMFAWQAESPDASLDLF